MPSPASANPSTGADTVVSTAADVSTGAGAGVDSAEFFIFSAAELCVCDNSLPFNSATSSRKARISAINGVAISSLSDSLRLL